MKKSNSSQSACIASHAQAVDVARLRASLFFSNTQLTTKLLMVCMCLLLASCGVFSDERDRVLEGSLTLTPLRLPKTATPPDNRNALHVPEIVYDDFSSLKKQELEQPPVLDTALASQIEKNLGSDLEHSKQDLKTFPANMTEVAGGLPELRVDGDFDLLWPYMETIMEKLGFKVSDRDRSKHLYYITRDLPISDEEKEQIRLTGVERKLGNSESYQVEVAPLASAQANAKASVVRIRNDAGQLENTALSRHMLAQIKAYLEQPLQ